MQARKSKSGKQVRVCQRLRFRSLQTWFGKPVEHLIEQMEKAGLVKKSPGDIVSDEEKIQLIQFLSKSGRVSLRRKNDLADQGSQQA